MAVTKNSTFAAMAGEKYKVAFRRAQWAFSIDQCISSLFFLITVPWSLSMVFKTTKLDRHLNHTTNPNDISLIWWRSNTVVLPK